MENKHTPGPWSTPHLACEDVKCDCAYVLSEGYAGAICTIEVGDGKRVSDGGNDCPPLEEAKANARLIAAAPDLLEACRTALALFADDHALSRFDWGKAFLRAEDIRELNELPGLLKKLIAKVEGGRP